MKFAMLACWLLATPFLLKSFDLLPYGYLIRPYIYSWNGGLTISNGTWKMVYLTDGWPSISRVPTFLALDSVVPDWKARLQRGESVTFHLKPD